MKKANFQFKAVKKVFFLCFILSFAACKNDQVRITGRITNAEKTVLHLDEVDVYNIIPADSTLLKKNGRFSYTIHTKVPCFYQLRLSPDKVIVLFPKPGEHIKIEADAKNLLSSLKTSGSHDTEQITKLIVMLNETRTRLDSVAILYEKATADTLKNLLNQEYQDILERHRKASIAYILMHNNSLSSLYALYQQYRPGYYVFYRTTDIQYFKIVSDSLSKYFPGSQHVTALKAHTKKMIGDYKTQVILQNAGQIKESLPEIALPDLNGDTLTLRSMKGRYVLLSFWAASDRNCVSQNLQLKKVYDKYRNKGFEIFQVSFDSSPETWRRAVKFDELTWVSVIDEGSLNSSVAGNYNVTQLPSNYLIDKDNVSILAKNLTPAQLQEKLRELYH
jgi:peroxiredoxin